MAQAVEVEQTAIQTAIPDVACTDTKTASAGVQAAESRTARQSPAAKSVEKHVNQLLAHISPTSESNAKRQRVIDFVQGLVKQHFRSIGYEVDVHVFGSVALKAYLPDGDIDFALLGRDAAEPEGRRPLREMWTQCLADVFTKERQKAQTALRIGEVQVINAEVKLLKCLVEDVVVDISFETIGGLRAATFLTSLDLEISKRCRGDCLFIRSVILVKAWCYYESRLLGAHHGLLSSYALETMVLYIFNIYHRSVKTPFQALYKFLDVMSVFDWEQHCVSMTGRVLLASFPNYQVDLTERDGGLLLDEHAVEPLLKQVRQDGPSGPRAFQRKFVNVQDPLLPTNNLGRSVSKYSFTRMKRAMAHSAHALKTALHLPPEEAVQALRAFFNDTWRTVLPPPTPPPPPHLLDALTQQAHIELLQALYAQRSMANGTPHAADLYAPILANGQHVGSATAHANGRIVPGTSRRPATRAQSPSELAAAGGQPNGLRSHAEGQGGALDAPRPKADPSHGLNAGEPPQPRPVPAEMALPAPQQLQRPAYPYQMPSYAVPLANGGLSTSYHSGAGGNGRRTPPAPRSEPDMRMYQSSQGGWRGQQQQRSAQPPPPPARPYQPPAQHSSQRAGAGGNSGGPPRRPDATQLQGAWLSSRSVPDAASIAQVNGGRIPGSAGSVPATGPAPRQVPGGVTQSAPVSPRFGTVPAIRQMSAALPLTGMAAMPTVSAPLPNGNGVGSGSAVPIGSLPQAVLQSPPPLTLSQPVGWPLGSANGPGAAAALSSPGAAKLAEPVPGSVRSSSMPRSAGGSPLRSLAATNAAQRGLAAQSAPSLQAAFVDASVPGDIAMTADDFPALGGGGSVQQPAAWMPQTVGSPVKAGARPAAGLASPELQRAADRPASVSSWAEVSSRVPVTAVSPRASDIRAHAMGGLSAVLSPPRGLPQRLHSAEGGGARRPGPVSMPYSAPASVAGGASPPGGSSVAGGGAAGSTPPAAPSIVSEALDGSSSVVGSASPRDSIASAPPAMGLRGPPAGNGGGFASAPPTIDGDTRAATIPPPATTTEYPPLPSSNRSSLAGRGSLDPPGGRRGGREGDDGEARGAADGAGAAFGDADHSARLEAGIAALQLSQTQPPPVASPSRVSYRQMAITAPPPAPADAVTVAAAAAARAQAGLRRTVSQASVASGSDSGTAPSSQRGLSRSISAASTADAVSGAGPAQQGVQQQPQPFQQQGGFSGGFNSGPRPRGPPSRSFESRPRGPAGYPGRPGSFDPVARGLTRKSGSRTSRDSTASESACSQGAGPAGLTRPEFALEQDFPSLSAASQLASRGR